MRIFIISSFFKVQFYNSIIKRFLNKFDWDLKFIAKRLLFRKLKCHVVLNHFYE